MIRVYELSLDIDRVRQMQEASLTRRDVGLAPAPLIGSPEWWHAVETGARPTQVLAGEITRVYWGSMADWPEFAIIANGEETSWTREGEIRRYVDGLHAQLAYVEHPLKEAAREAGWLTGPMSKVVLSIDVEESSRRASGIAPGPGGMSFQLTRQRIGDVVHYIRFSEAERAARASEAFRRQSLVVPPKPRDHASLGWLIGVGHRDASTALRWRSELETQAQQLGGTYDGGEIVGGEVWGAVDSAT